MRFWKEIFSWQQQMVTTLYQRLPVCCCLATTGESKNFFLALVYLPRDSQVILCNRQLSNE
jgi:hypothetical protein